MQNNWIKSFIIHGSITFLRKTIKTICYFSKRKKDISLIQLCKANLFCNILKILNYFILLYFRILLLCFKIIKIENCVIFFSNYFLIDTGCSKIIDRFNWHYIFWLKNITEKIGTCKLEPKTIKKKETKLYMYKVANQNVINKKNVYNHVTINTI